jgi:hypothetical protein
LQKYDPTTEVFTQTGKMSVERNYSSATLLPEGRVLIADFGSAEFFDPVAGVFSGILPAQSPGYTATLLTDGTVLLAGGCCGVLTDTASIHHPSVVTPAPVLLSVSLGGQGAILHGSTHQVVSPDDPAVAG